MLRITVESALPNRADVNAWIRAHGVDPNTCTKVEIDPSAQFVMFFVTLRDANGWPLRMSGDHDELVRGTYSAKIRLPFEQKWCEVEA